MLELRRHWTTRYLFDRGLETFYRATHPGAPWLTPASVRFISGQLNPKMAAFEFGSGRSTAWFARRIRKVVSVEHNPHWYRTTGDQIRKDSLTNVKIIHIPITGTDDRRRYAESILYSEESSFDLVLIDGAARDICTIAALSRIRPGGLLVIDNVNRYLPSESRAPGSRSIEDGPLNELWADIWKRTSKWPLTWTSSGVTDTAIWRKQRAHDHET
jgi:predicted O-methyltransferase YrrM